MVSTVEAGSHIRGTPGGFFCNGADAWRKPTMGFSFLGKMSSGNKKKRLLYDIERCMKNVISANKSEVATDYMSLLRNRLVVPLIEEGQDGIDEVIELMNDYGWCRV